MAKKINVVTLGCSKNVVDSEVLMYQLQKGGWEIIHNSNDTSAKVVIVNTCGFIADAKEESIDTILNFINAKEHGLIDKVYVMGCLSQRYRNELISELPEVDGFYGVSDLPLILSDLNTSLNQKDIVNRLQTTPSHFAYLKISEGCNWGCSYCAIPLIRGKHRSRTMDSLIQEARLLAQKGVKELIVIAQDTTYYGYDLYGKRRIAELMNELSNIDGIDWIRLHYAYPYAFPKELIWVMRDNPKICKYIDVPLQHINDNVLKMMRRGIDRAQTIDFINQLRSSMPDLAIRTTFLVGHPGETREAFDELLEFVNTFRFDRVGVFEYSEEDGTYAQQHYPDSIEPKEKRRRHEALMQAQQNISYELNQKRVGRIFNVIVDGFEDNYLVCRTEYDSPEVDQEVLVVANGAKVNPGDFINVRVTSATEYDLYGEIVL